jgi:hypothetical protein
VSSEAGVRDQIRMTVIHELGRRAPPARIISRSIGGDGCALRVLRGKHDDQADSTSQALDWVRQGYSGPGVGILNYYRQEYEKLMLQKRGVSAMKWKARSIRPPMYPVECVFSDLTTGGKP